MAYELYFRATNVRPEDLDALSALATQKGLHLEKFDVSPTGGPVLGAREVTIHGPRHALLEMVDEVDTWDTDMAYELYFRATNVRPDDLDALSALATQKGLHLEKFDVSSIDGRALGVKDVRIHGPRHAMLKMVDEVDTGRTPR